MLGIGLGGLPEAVQRAAANPNNWRTIAVSVTGQATQNAVTDASVPDGWTFWILSMYFDNKSGTDGSLKVQSTAGSPVVILELGIPTDQSRPIPIGVPPNTGNGEGLDFLGLENTAVITGLVTGFVGPYFPTVAPV